MLQIKPLSCESSTVTPHNPEAQHTEVQFDGVSELLDLLLLQDFWGNACNRTVKNPN